VGTHPLPGKSGDVASPTSLPNYTPGYNIRVLSDNNHHVSIFDTLSAVFKAGINENQYFSYIHVLQRATSNISKLRNERAKNTSAKLID